ncbi:hypothetical protein HV436_01295 [Bacillus sporothermodurans]|uniref:hypothetical protein n=1 Tax=Heyndrickxia sporothermodurans TaxID=46224 RepID=UPI00192B5E8C|nr:hypothetical protein [Heyndrickxia sporothermodurans]MBL5776971.1 hypothetical protein [Heyndrickxia sporothermodurans]MBL5798498.1 hypothetical protein [Heyndrickxia sporothermodurans]MBL5809415.1 hypothetical protein [Heyndrickxia sporothermodurans]MBL5813050.1 hypothetical protein [Heyndrickxia sporothermodurans]MBL5816474.1 hypothetical protein [Heyndrickxia sporothermodurans]
MNIIDNRIKAPEVKVESGDLLVPAKGNDSSMFWILPKVTRTVAGSYSNNQFYTAVNMTQKCVINTEHEVEKTFFKPQDVYNYFVKRYGAFDVVKSENMELALKGVK